jgi:hypothetical protein
LKISFSFDDHPPNRLISGSAAPKTVIPETPFTQGPRLCAGKYEKSGFSRLAAKCVILLWRQSMLANVYGNDEQFFFFSIKISSY